MTVLVALAAAGCSSPATGLAGPGYQVTGSPSTGSRAGTAAGLVSSLGGIVDGGSGKTADQRMAMVQDGSAFLPVYLRQERQLPAFSTLSAKATAVVFESPQTCQARAGVERCATVVYGLFVGTKQAMASQEAVFNQTGSGWVLSAPSYCWLLSRTGATCPPGTSWVSGARAGGR